MEEGRRRSRATVGTRPGWEKNEWAMAASLVWFLVAIAVDVVMVAFGSSGWSQELAAMLLVGVLAQLVLAVLVFVGPMLRGRDLATRDRLIARVERLALLRAATFTTTSASACSSARSWLYGSPIFPTSRPSVPVGSLWRQPPLPVRPAALANRDLRS